MLTVIILVGSIFIQAGAIILGFEFWLMAIGFNLMFLPVLIPLANKEE